MKQLLTMVALFAAAVALAELPTQADIRSDLRRVAEWQVVHQPQSGLGPTAWTNGALYQGMLDWGELAEREEKDLSFIRWVDGIGGGVSLAARHPPRQQLPRRRPDRLPGVAAPL